MVNDMEYTLICTYICAFIHVHLGNRHTSFQVEHRATGELFFFLVLISLNKHERSTSTYHNF